MASRANKGDKGEGSSGSGGASAPAWTRAYSPLVLGAVLLLALYTLLTVVRIARTDPQTGAGGGAAAERLAARAEIRIERLRASAEAAADRLSHDPGEPLDAAETALRIAHPAASAAAVIDGDQVVAASGARDLAWRSAILAVKAAHRVVWVGAPQASPGEPRSRWTFVAAAAGAPSTHSYVLLAADLSDLTQAASARGALIATPGGDILAARGLAPDAADLSALGIDPAQIALAQGGPNAGAARAVGVGAGPDHRPPLEFVSSPDGGLLAAVPASGVQPRTLAYNLFSLLAPLAIGAGLILMLALQTRSARAAQAAQGESERKFRMAVEAARCGIWEWRLHDNTVYMSDVTGVMLGWGGGGLASSEDVLARIAPEHRERVRSALREAQAFGGFDVSFCVQKETGGVAWIDTRGQAFGEPNGGGYSTLIGVALDVTEERTAEQRAQAAERRLHDAIDSVSEAFVHWDKHGRLLMCNKNFRDFFSLEPRILKPGATRELVQKVADLAIKRHAPEGQRGVREVEMIDGRWLQISERRTADNGYVITAADISAVKRQEEARRLNEEALQHMVERLEETGRELSELAEKYQVEKVRAESANNAKSEFLANMSHELRTPLNAINGFSEMMVGEMFGPLGDGRYKDYAQDILSSGQHLLNLINDILDMAKIEAGKLSLHYDWIDMGDMVHDSVRLMRNRAEAASLELIETISAGLPELEADHRAVKQVLLNLLSNAIKFTPPGGKVEVRVWASEPEVGPSRISVSVSDTGIGIRQEDIDRLGRPFEQIETQHSKTQQGTGLGLALTKSLVEMHDGSFELDSEPGVGTTATFTLPMQRTRKAKPVLIGTPAFSVS